jgi:hypothetical protein
MAPFIEATHPFSLLIATIFWKESFSAALNPSAALSDITQTKVRKTDFIMVGLRAEEVSGMKR